MSQALSADLRWRLLDLADRIARLEISATDPSRFAMERSALAHELRQLARGPVQAVPRERIRSWRAT